MGAAAAEDMPASQQTMQDQYEESKGEAIDVSAQVFQS